MKKTTIYAGIGGGLAALMLIGMAASPWDTAEAPVADASAVIEEQGSAVSMSTVETFEVEAATIQSVMDDAGAELEPLLIELTEEIDAFVVGNTDDPMKGPNWTPADHVATGEAIQAITWAYIEGPLADLYTDEDAALWDAATLVLNAAGALGYTLTDEGDFFRVLDDMTFLMDTAVPQYDALVV